jgi:mRNA-degrading endonuclease toxin of MazEF toxin-antitoxin module
VIVTQDEVLDIRANVTVAEITTKARGLVVEIPIDTDSGVDQASVVDGDGLHTSSQRRLTKRLGIVQDEMLDEIGEAIATALGCDAF